MQTDKIGNHIIKNYSDIEELPIIRYSKFNKFMILNEKIGSTFNDVDKHFGNLYKLINNPAKLKTQLDNFRQLIHSIDNEQSFENLAYACLIYSIDDIKYNDLTDDGLNDTLLKLQNIKAKAVKKKSMNFLIRHIKSFSNLIRQYFVTQKN